MLRDFLTDGNPLFSQEGDDGLQEPAPAGIILDRILHNDRRAFPVAASDGLKDLVNRMTARSKDDRPSMQEVLAAVDELSSGGGLDLSARSD